MSVIIDDPDDKDPNDDLDGLGDVLSEGSVDPDLFREMSENQKVSGHNNHTYAHDDNIDSVKDPDALINKRIHQRKLGGPRHYNKDGLVLNPDFETIQKCKAVLTEYYQNNPQFLKNKNIDVKISEVINASKQGWICASKDFIQRLIWKTKCEKLREISTHGTTEDINRARYNMMKDEQLKVDIDDLEQKADIYRGYSAMFIKDALPEHEFKYWLERESEYRKEYDFNNSSDHTLLQTVLLEELTHYRLMLQRMQDPYNPDLDYKLTESLKRYTIALEKLGVTRNQREKEKEDDNISVAQMAVNLEKKLKMMREREQKYIKEEEELQAAKEMGLGLRDLPEDLAKALREAMQEEEMMTLSALREDSDIEVDEDLSDTTESKPY